MCANAAGAAYRTDASYEAVTQSSQVRKESMRSYESMIIKMMRGKGKVLKFYQILLLEELQISPITTTEKEEVK